MINTEFTMPSMKLNAEVTRAAGCHNCWHVTTVLLRSRRCFSKDNNVI
jgi:hypothetical protein